MRKFAFALAAAAALVTAAPASAAVIPFNYQVSGSASGSFQLNFDNVTNLYSLLGINLSINGTAFTTANSDLSGSSGTLTLGGNPDGVLFVSVAPGDDDFYFVFNPNVDAQSPVLFYHLAADAATETQGSIDISRSLLPGVPAGVPEPATWAMMLAGFAGIGLALRRGKRLAIA